MKPRILSWTLRVVTAVGLFSLVLAPFASVDRADGMKLDSSHFVSDADNKNLKIPASDAMFDESSSGSRFGEFFNASHGDGMEMDWDMGRNRTHSGLDADSPMLEEGGSLLHVHVVHGGTLAADVDAVTTPEPATLLLLGTGLMGFGFLRRRQKTSN
jgi:hypothetical protein